MTCVSWNDAQAYVLAEPDDGHGVSGADRGGMGVGGGGSERGCDSGPWH